MTVNRMGIILTCTVFVNSERIGEPVHPAIDVLFTLASSCEQKFIFILILTVSYKKSFILHC